MKKIFGVAMLICLIGRVSAAQTPPLPGAQLTHHFVLSSSWGLPQNDLKSPVSFAFDAWERLDTETDLVSRSGSPLPDPVVSVTQSFTVTCLKSCTPETNHVYAFEDSPDSAETLLALSQFAEEDPNLIAVWASAQNYRVRVFRIVNRSVVLALDTVSAQYPQLSYDGRGELQIGLMDSRTPTSAQAQLWRWNGKAFQNRSKASRPRKGHSGRRA